MRLGMGLLTILVVSGCSGGPAVSGKVAEGVFVDQQGQPLCPVMSISMDSADKAVGSAQHEGVTYYFCCAECPEKFKADPAKYALGK